ncbi:MAG: protein kinase domain-containing protein [Syntrophothermus sp.]
MNEYIGRQIDNYRIDALLGEGGMGMVFRGYDLGLKRPVAIKFMHRQWSVQEEFRKRFLQEAQVAAHLGEQHASIIRIYYLSVKQDPIYMVMAYISGGCLDAHIRRILANGQAVPLREVLILMAQVADGLGFAHRQGVIHRDIKPSNILLQHLEKPDESGLPLHAVIGDFGLAKVLQESTSIETAGVIGTYAYMSPEQTLGKPLDGRSDIYSLGVMLYELCTGKRPLDIKRYSDAVLKHQQGETPLAPRAVWNGLPERVETIILKALAKRPEDRYQKAEALAADLHEAARGLTEGEVTQFLQQRNAVSLATARQPEDAVFEPSRMGRNISPAAQADLLVIAQKDHTPRTLQLDKAHFTIGREPDNDIVLPDNAVSRHHARIERCAAGWQVVDLRSTNKTFLEDTPLLPGIPEVLDPGKTLRVGPFFIHWKKADVSASAKRTTGPSAGKRPLPQGARQFQTSSGNLYVVVSPENFAVTPGKSVEVQLELSNQSLIVDHFNLRLEGIPAEWADLPGNPVKLDSGSSDVLNFSVHPPLSSRARAGLYPYTLKIESVSRSEETAVVKGTITIQPFEQFSVDLQPSQLSSGSKTWIIIRNDGNDDGTYQLAGRDAGDAIHFDGQHDRIKVQPGDTTTVEMTLAAKKQPLLGSSQMLPFEVQVKSNTGASEKKEGQLEVKPRFPAWAMPLTGSLLTVLCISALCLVLFFSLGRNILPGWFSPPDQGGGISTVVSPIETQPGGGQATSPVTAPSKAPSSTTPNPLPGQGLEMQWKTVENRAVISHAEEYWEKYQSDTQKPGLYLRTDMIEAFGDFLELNSDFTYLLEQGGVRTTGIWKVDADKVILVP